MVRAQENHGPPCKGNSSSHGPRDPDGRADLPSLPALAFDALAVCGVDWICGVDNKLRNAGHGRYGLAV